MIARTWRGVTAAADADAYVEFLDRTGVADCRAIPGNRGVYVFRRPDGERTEFLFLSLWDDMEAVRAFAGDDPTRARFYPEDERLLVDRDWHVTHFTVERDIIAFDREASA